MKSIFVILLFLAASPFAATVASDDFNRADAANLGANWTVSPNNSNLRIVSNQAEANQDPSLMAYTNRVADQDGQVGVTLKTLATTAGQGFGPARRVSTTGNTGYFVAASSGYIALYKVVTDSYSELANYTGTISTNDVLVLKATGTTTTTLVVYQNGTQRISYADNTSPITSGRDGLFGSIDGAIHPTGDDWYVDDLTGGGATAGGFRALLNVGK